jgi:hypothetical protein
MIKVTKVAVTALSAGGMLIGTLLLAAQADTANMLLRINTPSAKGDAVLQKTSRLRAGASASQGG